MQNNSYILSIFRKFPFRLLLVFLCNILSVLLTITVFLLIEPLTKILFHGDFEDLSPVSRFVINTFAPVMNLQDMSSSVVLIVVFVISLFFFKNLFYYLSQWIMASLRSYMLSNLRDELYEKFLRLPLSFFSGQKRGDVVAKAVNDTQEVQNTILNAIRLFITEPITILFFLVALFAISARLTLYVLLLLPLSFLFIGWASASLRRTSRRSKQRFGQLLSHVEETVSGLRVVKGFNAQSEASSVFHRLNDDFAKTQTTVYRLVDLASPLCEFLGVSVVMAVLVLGGSMVLSPESKLSAELFITYIALITQVINPMKNLSSAFSSYKRGQAALDRIREILCADETIHSPEHPVPVRSFERALTMERLSFAYDAVEVLSDVSITVNKGETVALVGASGSGKTTLTDLMERFYDPTSGRICLDGVDIRSLSLPQYRSLFALVSQDVVLFNDTLYNNITLGLDDVKEEDVVSALKMANIYDFVVSLPDGLYHHLSDRGLNLSGGQRQRLSIARALLRNAPILILDEATSAMDTESERVVQRALDNLMKMRTVIVIAHRLSTIQNADRIYLLDKGRVVEQGTHRELLSHKGIYSKLIEIQQIK